MSSMEVIIKRLPLILIQTGEWQENKMPKGHFMHESWRTDPQWKIEEYNIQITNALFDNGYEYPTTAELLIKLIKPK